MNQISLTLLLGLLPLVFLVQISDKSDCPTGDDCAKISHKDEIMNTLNGLNSESFPLLESFKTTLDNLPEDKLRGVIQYLEELIAHARGHEADLVDRVAFFQAAFIANQSSYNDSVVDQVSKDNAAEKAGEDAADAKAAKEEHKRLTDLAEVDYNNAVADHASADMSSTIEALEGVKLIIEGLLPEEEDEEEEHPGFITKWSEGTKQWPDQACNPTNSFSSCNSNAQDAADSWATYVCQLNGYTSGVWTGNKAAGCNGDHSLWCGQYNGNPCAPVWESSCAASDQTKVEVRCSS